MTTKAAGDLNELEDRDPNNLGQHLQVAWIDVIGEPETIRSPECAWRLSHNCFRISKDCCYVFLSVLCAPITACCLGCTFACIAFEHIWCLIPCLRIWKISCSITRSFVTSIVDALLVPIMNAFSLLFSGIIIRTQSILIEPSEKKKDILII